MHRIIRVNVTNQTGGSGGGRSLRDPYAPPRCKRMIYWKGELAQRLPIVHSDVTGPAGSKGIMKSPLPRKQGGR